MRSEPITISRSTAESGIGTAPSRPWRRPTSPATMLPTKLRSCGAPGRDGLAPVDAPDQQSEAASMLLALVEVLGLLVAGEVDDPVVPLARLLADREQHRVAQPAAAEHHGLALGHLGRRPGRAPSPRPARPGGASSTGASEPPISSTISDRSPRPDRPRRRSAPGLHQQRRAVDARGVRLEVLQAVELPGWKLRAAAGARTTTSMMVGVSRSTATTRAVRSSSSRQPEGVPLGVGLPRAASARAPCRGTASAMAR